MDILGWFSGFSQKVVADFLKWFVPTVGPPVIAWLKSKNLRWATLVLNTIVGWVCLYILFYGLSMEAIASFTWWQYVVAVGSLVLFVILDWKRREQSVPLSLVDTTPAIQSTTKPIEFYDSRTEKNNLRGDLAKELVESKRVWFAAIGGSQITDIPDATLQKLDRVLLNNPNSECMQMLIALQPGRGNLFPHFVEQAVAKCREKGKAIKLRNDFVVNVIISDPEEPGAWARVQSFIPYYLGQDSPSYVVRKTERLELFERIKHSFEQTWKDATEPEGRNFSQPVKGK